MAAAADTEFSEFMHGRWPQLVRLGYGLTGDLQLAEDLAQTAFARAYASWGRVRRADNLGRLRPAHRGERQPQPVPQGPRQRAAD